MKFRDVILYLVCAMLPCVAGAQTITLQPDPTSGKDAVVTIADATGTLGNDNYGTDTEFEAARYNVSGTWYKSRSFLEFDLSSIPSNAIITSSTLYLYGLNHINTGQVNTSVIQRVDASWDESTITWNNQPSTYTTNELTVANSSSATQDYTFDVKTHVQDMVTNPSRNFGWMVKLSGESNSLAAQLTFASSDYTSNTAKRPKLEVTYILLSFDVVNASSPSAADGAVNLNVTGSNSPYSFSWSNSATTQNISGLGVGSYEVTVTDNVSNQVKAYAFVGSISSAATINVQPGPETGIDATVVKRDVSDNVGHTNNGTYANIIAQRWTISGSWYKYRSFLKFDLSSIPTNAVVTSANLYLGGLNHSPLSQTNACVLQRVTENWSEGMVSWNTQPATTSTGEVLIPQSTSSTQDMTISITDHIQDMINNPETNYGWLMKLTGEANNLYARMIFASSDYTTTTTKRPKLEITYYVPETQMNWTLETVYDESGNVIGQSKVYMDNLGRETQKMYKNNTANTVVTSQTLYDSHGRPALKTLPAPSGSSLLYKDRFITNASGLPYKHADFDSTITLNSPNPVQNTIPNTLGYHYSDNGAEAFVATSSYPYIRTEYTADPTAQVKRSAAAGDQYKMGSGHETEVYHMESGDELKYIFGTDKSFKSSIDATDKMVNSALTITGGILCSKTVSEDADGNEVVSYKQGDRIIATCYSGFTGACSMTSVTNYMLYDGTRSVDIHLPSANKSSLTLPKPQYYDWDFEAWYDVSNSDITYKITDLSTNILLVAGTDYTFNTTTRAVTFLGSYASGSSVFRISFDYSSSFLLQAEDMGWTLQDPKVQYALDYSKWAVNYYDLTGNLRKVVSPKGINCSSAGTISFATTYDYDTEGRAIAVKSADEGTTETVYDSEGKVRFSQNEVQRSNNKFSYINYDEHGRAVENGEYGYTGNAGSVYFTDYYGSSGALSACGTCVAASSVIDQEDGLPDAECSEEAYTAYYTLTAGEKLTSSFSSYSQYLDKEYMGKVSKTWNDNTSTWYCYDNGGRLSAMVQQVKDSDYTGAGNITSDKQYKTIDYTYNKYLGRLSEETYQKNDNTEKLIHYYTYDSDQRLQQVNIENTTFGSSKQQVKYFYYTTGAAKRKELGDKVQGIDYVYTINGQLKTINHPSLDGTKDPGQDGQASTTNADFAADVFGFAIDYHSNDYSRSSSNVQSSSSSGSYVGLINAIRYKVRAVTNSVNNGADYIDYLGTNQSAVVTGTTEEVMIQYTYDAFDRLSIASFGKYNNSTNTFTARTESDYREFGNSSLSGINYDDNGNITRLIRQGYYRVSVDNSSMDNLAYTYTSNTNKLASVSDAVSGSNYGDFSTTAGTGFTYNGLGQMTGSTPENVQTVEYNARGLVKKVTFATNNNSYAEYFYNDQGKKYKTKYTDRSNLSDIIYKITWYAFNGVAIYEQETSVSTDVSMKEQTVGGIAGRIGVLYTSSNDVNYELTDHLGNVRATVKYAGVSGTQTIAQVTYWADYYAFGGVMPGRNYTLNAYRYAYQGNENDCDLGNNTDWSSFELRLHNNDLGRWMSPDPYGQFYSPYISMGNNPVSGRDPDGGFVNLQNDGTFSLPGNGVRHYRNYYDYYSDEVLQLDELMMTLQFLDKYDVNGSSRRNSFIDNDQQTFALWDLASDQKRIMESGKMGSWYLGLLRRGGMYSQNLDVFATTSFITGYIATFRGKTLGMYSTEREANFSIWNYKQYLKFKNQLEQHFQQQILANSVTAGSGGIYAQGNAFEVNGKPLFNVQAINMTSGAAVAVGTVFFDAEDQSLQFSTNMINPARFGTNGNVLVIYMHAQAEPLGAQMFAGAIPSDPNRNYFRVGYSLDGVNFNIFYYGSYANQKRDNINNQANPNATLNWFGPAVGW